MGSAFTAQADRAAGRQAGWRPLPLYEADDALSERLDLLIRMVGRLRTDLHRYHGADSPVNDRVDELEEQLCEFEVEIDHVKIRVYPGEYGGA